MSYLSESGTRLCSNPRLCDLCNSSNAFLYCRADSAKLCFNCDREAHFSNPLFQKHTRSLLCDGCDSAPGSIFCCSDSTVLCQNCDWEIHGNSVGAHDKRPTKGFSGWPSVTELLNFLGLEDLTKKNDEDDDGWMDLLVWETAPVVNLDNLIVTKDCADSPHSFQALGVPPLPKNRNSVCGKHKEDILRQLREIAINEHEFDACLGDFDVSVSDNCVQQQTLKLSGLFCEQISSSEQGHGFPLIETNNSISETDLDIGDVTANHLVPDANVFQVSSNSVVRELNTQERDCALSRYKEKKKTRRYDKQIRYESRKVRAEARRRIMGRFAKIEQ